MLFTTSSEDLRRFLVNSQSPEVPNLREVGQEPQFGTTPGLQLDASRSVTETSMPQGVEVPYVHVREFTNQLRAFKVPLDPSFARARVGVGAECARLAGRNAFLLCGRKEEMLLVERSGGLVHMGSATQFNRSSVDFPEFTHPFRR